MRINTDKVQKRTSYVIDKSLGIEAYDKDNLYPYRVLDIMGGSGAASICNSRLKKYIIGGGFQNEAFAATVVNRRKETANHLLRHIAFDMAYINGFALHVNYNQALEIAEVNYIPFKYCRLGLPDDNNYVGKIAIYDNWDRHKPWRKNDIAYLNVFNPDPEVIQKQIDEAGDFDKYKGQVLWFSTAGENVYPLAVCDPVLEDVEVDSQIKLFKYRNITTGFMASHLFVTKGRIEKEEERTDFIKNIEKFQGADNASKILWVETENEEQEPKITPFNVVNNDKLYEYHESSVQENIRMCYGLPPVLFNAIPGKLGDSSERSEAVKQYNEETSDERATISEQLTKVLAWANPSNDFEIKELSITETQPATV